jgi:hypothetical protein
MASPVLLILSAVKINNIPPWVPVEGCGDKDFL